MGATALTSESVESLAAAGTAPAPAPDQNAIDLLPAAEHELEFAAPAVRGTAAVVIETEHGVDSMQPVSPRATPTDDANNPEQDETVAGLSSQPSPEFGPRFGQLLDAEPAPDLDVLDVGGSHPESASELADGPHDVLELDASDLIEVGAFSHRAARLARAQAGHDARETTEPPPRGPIKPAERQQVDAPPVPAIAANPGARAHAPRLEDGPMAPDDETYQLGTANFDLAQGKHAPSHRREQFTTRDAFDTELAGEASTDKARPKGDEVEAEDIRRRIDLRAAQSSGSVDVIIVGDEGSSFGEFSDLLADECGGVCAQAQRAGDTLLKLPPGLVKHDYVVPNSAFCTAGEHIRTTQRWVLWAIAVPAVALIVGGLVMATTQAVVAGCIALALEVIGVRALLMRSAFSGGHVNLAIWQVPGDMIARDGKATAALARFINARSRQAGPAQVSVVFLEDPLLVAPIHCHQAHQRRRRLEKTVASMARHFRERAPNVDIRVIHCVERADLLHRIVTLFGGRVSPVGPASSNLTAIGIIPRPTETTDDLESLAPEAGGHYVDLSEIAALAGRISGRPSAAPGRAGGLQSDLVIGFDTSANTQVELIADAQHDVHGANQPSSAARPNRSYQSSQGDHEEPTLHAVRTMLERWELQCAIDPAAIELVTYDYDRRARQRARPAMQTIMASAGAGLLRAGWSATRTFRVQ